MKNPRPKHRPVNVPDLTPDLVRSSSSAKSPVRSTRQVTRKKVEPQWQCEGNTVKDWSNMAKILKELRRVATSWCFLSYFFWMW